MRSPLIQPAQFVVPVPGSVLAVPGAVLAKTEGPPSGRHLFGDVTEGTGGQHPLTDTVNAWASRGKRALVGPVLSAE